MKKENLRIRYYPALLWAMLVCLIAACQQPGDIGADLKDHTPVPIVYIDTLSVSTTTVLLDSLPTSANKGMLFGRYHDQKLGAIEASSIFQVSLGETVLEPVSNARYDSLQLILHYTGYHYGDTTAGQHLLVHRLAKELIPSDDGYLYNTHAFSVEEQPLARYRFTARPLSGDSLAIRLDDRFGLELFGYAQKGDNRLSSESSFQEYLKGFALVPDPADNGAIIGFGVGEATITGAVLRVFYHQDDELSQSLTHDFPLSSSSLHYTHLKADRSGTALEGIEAGGKVAEAGKTHEETYIQSGIGLVTKVQFPYLQQLRETAPFLYIMRAELLVEPVKNSYLAATPPPDVLGLYLTDGSNRALAPLTVNGSKEIVSAFLQLDKEFGQQTYYLFNITQYITEQIQATDFNRRDLMLISLTPEMNSAVHRLYLGSNSHPGNKIKLRIYYTAYANQ